jgi:hypothetical protein
MNSQVKKKNCRSLTLFMLRLFEDLQQLRALCLDACGRLKILTQTGTTENCAKAAAALNFQSELFLIP